MRNILSIDLESWVHFRDSALLRPPSASTPSERRRADAGDLRRSALRLLDLLERHRAKATVFVLAETFEWDPGLIAAIRDRGHEIGFHSYDHALVRDRAAIEDQLRRSRDFLDRFRPVGYRAPQIIVTAGVLACLRDHGFEYSSSTYDDADARSIAGMTEYPVSTWTWRPGGDGAAVLPKGLDLRLLSRRIPFGSGMAVAALGSGIGRFITAFNRRRRPAVLFIHPWQAFPHPSIREPRFVLGVARRNPACVPYLRGIRPALERLLSRYEFTSFRDYHGAHGNG